MILYLWRKRLFTLCDWLLNQILLNMDEAKDGSCDLPMTRGETAAGVFVQPRAQGTRDTRRSHAALQLCCGLSRLRVRKGAAKDLDKVHQVPILLSDTKS